ncbi:hypothetical protein BGZ54_001929, partial [Gamsiella multidivaricata]
LTALFFIAAATMATIGSAAPVATSTPITVTSIPTSTSAVVPSAVATADVTTSKSDPEITANDAFSSAVTHSGRATWFEGSYGACNINWNGNSEPIVALNAHQMGEQSWGNPVCGRKVRITNTANGKSVVARIVDKCPGDECAWGSLDLSPAAFISLGGELAMGVLSIKWNYI